ncbi:MAG: hypothetical protein IPP71_04020 [Bacteroidetes bacterium]|nr:hypothetical protein [Bacteroidota bacterium]
MTIEEKALPHHKPHLTTYKEITFTEAEKLRIYENVSKHGLSLNTGMYLLAGVSQGMHDEIFSKQKSHNFIWAPVPVNVRKRERPMQFCSTGYHFYFTNSVPKYLMI